MRHKPIKILQRLLFVLTPLCIILVIINFNITFTKDAQSSPRLNITAHRGDSSNAPENTIPAIQKAIGDGADYIELDVRQTKDNVPVLLHDASLKRTAGINKDIWEFDYHELAQIDVGSWFGTQYTNTQIPTLEQVLQITKGKIKLNIEIKDSQYNQDIVPQVITLITKYNMEQECSISSTNYQYLQEVKSITLDIPTGIILDRVSNPNLYPTTDFYSIKYSLLTKDLIYYIHNKGKEIHAWTVDNETDMQDLREMNIDNIITNDPLTASAMLY